MLWKMSLITQAKVYSPFMGYIFLIFLNGKAIISSLNNENQIMILRDDHSKRVDCSKSSPREDFWQLIKCVKAN